MSLRAEKLLVSLALGGGFYVVFRFVATWAAAHVRPAPGWLITPLDAAMPLVPCSVWVYVSWYPATALGLLANRSGLRTFYLSYAVAFVLCVPFYFGLPIAIDRTIPADSTGLSTDMLRHLYALDPPVNLFPSYHAAIAAILASTPWGTCTRQALIVLWMLAICVSCVLTRQHYVLDVVAGVVAVGLSLALVRRGSPLRLRSAVRSCRW